MNDKKGLGAEEIILLIGLLGFVIFLGLAGLLLFSARSNPAALPPIIAKALPTAAFNLPPTWTPTPPQTVIPTPTATEVYDGRAPTPLYTPRPVTPVSGIPMFEIGPRPGPIAVIDLARIMQGESPGDLEAAYRVGWVAKNRLIHPGYGENYATVSHGFFGYRADLEPTPEFLELARRVIRAREDPTGGCLYALSRTDITKLQIPPGRADVAYGEWFFFRIWPLSSR